MGKMPDILIIDDDRNTREGLREALDDKYHIVLAQDAEAGLAALQKQRFDIVLTDWRMPGLDGMEFTKRISSRPDAPLIIFLTAYGSKQTASEAVGVAGAYDYLSKPINLETLEMIIERGLGELAEKRREQGGDSDGFSGGAAGIIGKSPEIFACLEEARQVASSRSTVLITGESGTGKELFARAIHKWSPRARKPFVAVHCAALNDNLLESELFGHEKGAFTGANERFIGRFERADSGTLFLDEIGEISLSTQVKLLRVLETRSIERVGGTVTIPVDVRLVAATNRDLKAMVADGTFREDLFYRLNVVNLRLPPLREHRADIPLLLEHYLRQAAEDNGRALAGIAAEASDILASYDWPGNIRELRNCVERMVVLARGNILTVSDIPRDIMRAVAGQSSRVAAVPPGSGEGAAENGAAAAAESVHPAVAAGGSLDIHDNEMAAIKQALERAGGNRTRAAELLGISRRTLQRKLKQYPELEGE